MQTKLLDGKALAVGIRYELSKTIKREALSPGLGAILVGEDPASQLYVSMKEKAAKEIGVRFEVTRLSTTAAQSELEAAISVYAARTDIHGILLQLPLPKGLNTEAAIAAIPVSKDADGFHADSYVVSPLIQAILALIHDSRFNAQEKTARVLANNETFKKRLSEKIAEIGFAIVETSPTDLVITALGKPTSLGRDDVNKGGVVIDAGTAKLNEKIVGDADATSLNDHLSALSPVPGGVGPLTVAFLLKNVVALAQR